MRRVVRTASPEALWISDAFPCSAESSFRELDDVFLQTQTRIWLGEVLHLRFDEEMAISDLLADGELLFQVSKVVWKKLLKKHVELKHSKVYIYERTSFGKSDGRYMPYPKVDSFLKICQILGLTGIDLFSPSDVVEKRDVRRVCMCIRSLSKKARLKNLDVPDFDIVTYTIAMPTDLVGGIRRNLEKSQCSSSSSNGCSPSMESREICRQKSFGGDHAQNYDSYSESDEAESTFAELEFHSPLSNVSYDAANPSHVVGDISSDVNLIFDENSSELQKEFHLDSQDQNEDGHKCTHLLAVSTDPSHARTIKNGSEVVKVVVHSKSPCAECQSDHGVRTCFSDMGEIMWPISNPETGNLINNVDVGCFQTRPSSFEDSPFKLDEQLAANAKAAFKGYTDTMLLNKDLENSLSKRVPFDSCKNLDYVKGFMKASVDSSGQAQEVNCTTGDSDDVTYECVALLEETSNKGSAYTIEALDGKPSCGNIMGSSDMTHDNVPLKACITEVEGMKENSDNSILSIYASGSVDNNSLPGNCTDLWPDTSGSALHSIDDGNLVQSVHSNCKGFKNGVKRSLDDVVDAEVASTPISNAILDNGSKDKFYINDCPANSFLFSEVHCLQEVEKCNFELEISASELVGSVAEEAANTHLYMETNEDGALLTPKKNSSSIDLDGTDRSSTSGKQISLGMLNDLQVDRDRSNMSHVDSDFIKNDLVLQSHSDSPCDPGTTQSKNDSSTCKMISDYCDDNEGKCTFSPNICPSCIFGTFKEARSLIPDSVIPDKDVCTPYLEVDAEPLNYSIMATEHEDVSTPDLTGNNLSVLENKTYSGSIVCLKNGAATNLNLDGFENRLMTGDCHSEADGKMEMKVIKQKGTSYCHPCGTNNDLEIEVEEDLCKKLCGENGLGENATRGSLEYGKSCCLPLNAKDCEDDGCSIPLYVEELSASWIELSTGCRESKLTTLSEYGTIRNLHAAVSRGISSNSDADYLSHQGIQQVTVSESDNTTLPMGNDVAEIKATADHLNEIHELETGGIKVPVDLNEAWTQGSNVLDGTKSMVINNVNLAAASQGQASDRISCCDPAHHTCLASTSSSTHLKEESRQSRVVLPCSAPAQESIRVETQVPLVGDVLTSMKHNEADGAVKGKKDIDIEECKPVPVTLLGSNGKDSEGAADEPQRPGKKVLTSVAGGVTLVGVLFLFLHLRGRRGRQKNSRTVVPLQTQKLKKDSTQKQEEIGNTDGLYPADRLKF